MKLRDIVVKKAILPSLVATKRDDAIRELVDALVDAGKVAPEQRDTFVKSIIARENRGSTGFGHGVAVPHAKSSLVKQLVVSVGISRNGVDFNALDEAVFYRSLAISGEDYHALPEILSLIGGAHQGPDAFDLVFVETVGAGQNETRIRQHVDKTVVVLTPGQGDAVQMDKAGILEIADLFVVNKADHAGEAKLVRELLDIASGRKIFETIATQGKGVVELLEGLFGA